MAASDVKLLGARPSPFVNRVQFALNLKSVDYEFLPELNFPAKSELLLKSNPVHKKIPVLIHGGKPVTESRVIIEYIDEAWPESGPSILPSDPYDRATARFWAAYVDDKWHPIVRSLADGNEESRAEIVEKLHEGLQLLEDIFVKSSKGKDYFGGDDLGYLDIVLGCFLGWLKESEISWKVQILEESKTPALAKWSEKFMSHRAVKGTLPEVEELLSLVKMVKAKAKAAPLARASK